VSRVREEDGFLLIELMVATVVLSIALLALMAGYDSAFLSVHKASQRTVATAIADQQLELYSALPYDSIGLDASALTTAAADATYDGNDLLDGTTTQPDGTVVESDGVQNEVPVSSCGTAASCLPIQTLTGTDGKSYRVETFVRDISPPASNHNWSTRNVWVIVRDPSVSGSPELVELQTAFDKDGTN
jgi:Tfp pilus assembly protein PilV